MFYVCLVVDNNGNSVQQMSGLKAMIEMYLMENMKYNHTAYIAKEEDYKVVEHYKKKRGSFVLEKIPFDNDLYLTDPYDDVNTWFDNSCELIADMVKLNIAMAVEGILNIYYDNEDQEKVTKDELIKWTFDNMQNEIWFEGGTGGWVEKWEDNPLSQMDITQIKDLISYYIDNYTDTKIALCE